MPTLKATDNLESMDTKTVEKIYFIVSMQNVILDVKISTWSKFLQVHVFLCVHRLSSVCIMKTVTLQMNERILTSDRTWTKCLRCTVTY